MDLQLSSRAGRGCTVVWVSGELDRDTRAQLQDTLGDVVDAGARQVVLDFTAVTFMDSSGLSLLVMWLRRLGDIGGRLCLANVQKSVRDVLVLSALDTVLDVYDTVEAAEYDVPSVAA
jgi:anti-sigma B factor antagonist